MTQSFFLAPVLTPVLAAVLPEVAMAQSFAGRDNRRRSKTDTHVPATLPMRLNQATGAVTARLE
ncbi:MAG: hypothetical protein B7Z38_07035 [Rhodobacterales bacterium 12-64-8]|nr:MAG: hypothetical protein B7Z38_07035 [Rhodobacterales bacterium 12-64-8]